MKNSIHGLLNIIDQSKQLTADEKKNAQLKLNQLEEELRLKNRELEIEAALEKVRARTMAMQKSDELRETSLVLFQQLKELGEPAEQITIGIINEKENVVEVSATLQGIKLLQSFRHDIDEPFVMNKMFKAWKAKQKTFELEQEWEELQMYNQYRNKLVGSDMFPVKLKPGDRRLLYVAFFSKGTLALSSNEPRPKETIQLLERFASVLDLTYTRFYDLQKAETLAREAQIEVSLERVRSKTLAMHNSQDVADTVATMFDEWVKLGIKTFRCGIGIFSENKQMEIWTARPGSDGKVVLVTGQMDMSIHPLLEGAYDGWKNKYDDFSYELKDNDIEKYFKAINSYVQYPVKYDITNMPSKIFHRDFYFAEGTLFVFSLEKLSAETSKILKRFAAVLGQTYRRFLDLQKAEAQTREAKIEAALERVRSKAMAMHKSDDLNAAVAIVFEEMHKLNLGLLRCGIGILHKEKRCADVWTTTIAEENCVVQIAGDESMDIHPLLQNAFEAWLRQEDSDYLLQGDDMSAYYLAVTKTNFHLPESQIMVEHDAALKHYYFATPFQSGMLFAFRDIAFTDEAKAVMKRFAGVFNLTYKRFLDIRNAEEQARQSEAQKQLIEEKHREITENISYALRIQSAILPSQKLIKDFLPDSFVLYLPKDVVAGDFYWMVRAKDAVLFAVCDCTGHGVSGAMVSVLCHNALNRAVREYNLTQPSLILDKVVELVEENFTQSENQIQDGMDTSLCAYYPQQQKFQWAGANNPLWIVRNNELLEYKPDKQPVGKYENRNPFTHHEIELQKGDNIYLFSDGYQDQFGGPNCKKLTKKSFKDIVLSISNNEMQTQHEVLLRHHMQWRGNEEQVDDICVLGMRV